MQSIRRLVTIAILASASAAFGAELAAVVQVDGTSAAELLGRARTWAATEYASGRAVTDLDDPASARIVVKAWVGVTYNWAAIVRVKHVVTIEAKDGRYRYEVAGTEVCSETSDLCTPLADWQAKKPKQYAKMAAALEQVAADLRAGMEKPTPAADKSW